MDKKLIAKLEKLVADPNGRNAIRAVVDDINAAVKETAEEREKRTKIIELVEAREKKAGENLVALPHNATAQPTGSAGSCEVSEPEKAGLAKHVINKGVKKIKKDGTVVFYSEREKRDMEAALLENKEWEDPCATMECDYI